MGVDKLKSTPISERNGKGNFTFFAIPLISKARFAYDFLADGTRLFAFAAH